MRLATRALRVVNAALARGGVELMPRQLDLAVRLESPRHVRRLCGRLAEQAEPWLLGQGLFEVRERFDVEAEVAAFMEDYLAGPWRTIGGGSRLNNLLWLDLIAKAMRPDVIVDSGTYRGASAWALSRGAPRARALSFDVDLSALVSRTPGVTYVGRDWTAERLPEGTVLAYFDDHVDQARRLLEAAERGVRVAIFDDDLDLGAIGYALHGGDSLPKVSNVLDEGLADGEVVAWSGDGRRAPVEWRVDGPYLARARAVVAGADRVPDLSIHNGIQQLPYRVVALASPADAGPGRVAVP